MQSDDAGLSVGEAARVLGISVPAVRKRIRRGTLRAYKVDGLWRVIVPPLPDAGSDAASPEAVQLGEAIGQAGLIAQLRSENEYLRGLVAELTRRIPELPAGSPPPEEAPTMPIARAETPVTPRERRPWWKWWTR